MDIDETFTHEYFKVMISAMNVCIVNFNTFVQEVFFFERSGFTGFD